MSKKAVVLGASGYVGSHVVSTLASRGWTVTGTVRNPDTAAWVKEAGAAELKPLTMAPEPGSCDAALDAILPGHDAVFFCSGFEVMDPSTIDFMVNNAVSVVRAARRHKVGVVVLSSSGGSTNKPGHPNELPKNEIANWSDPEVQKANGRWSPAAKTLMEINALQEVGRNQANEVVDAAAAEGAPRLCIMNPNLILGPQLAPGAISGNSLPWMVAILKGQRMNDKIPNDSMSTIDVRDLAALNVACAETPGASGRYFGISGAWRWEEILTALNKAYPEFKVPPRFEGEAAIATQFDFSRRESLGVPMRTLQETCDDLVAFFKTRGAL